jgi:hypothetical protein
MKEEQFEIKGFLITVTYHSEESELLLEAKSKGIPLIGTYSVMKHPPHTSPGEYHLHVHDGENQIFAINKSGSAHDGFHGVRIPNKVYKALTQKYKEWTFPPDQIIECINYTLILNPISGLTFREILAEIKVVELELNFHDSVKVSNINESTDLEHVPKENTALLNRFKDLYTETMRKLH